jgi:hypothetical protein
MNSKVVMILAVCFSFISLISASTILEIQTLPNHEIYITEIDAYASGNVAATQPLHTFTGKYGKVRLDYTPQKSSFKLGLLLKNGTRRVINYNVFEDIFHADETIPIEFLPNGISVEDVLASIEEEEVVEEEVNETEINDTVILDSLVEEEVEELDEEIKTNESSPGIFKGFLMNGHAVYKENKFVINLISYFLGAVVLVAPIYMLFKKGKFKRGSLIPDKLLKKEDDEEEAFEKAESDLKNARERIDNLKGKKISAARQKLIEDEKELMRLRNLGKG